MSLWQSSSVINSFQKKLSEKEKVELAEEFGVDKRKVEVWFNNRRQKERIQNLSPAKNGSSTTSGLAKNHSSQLMKVYSSKKYLSESEEIKLAQEDSAVCQKGVKTGFNNQRYHEKLQNASGTVDESSNQPRLEQERLKHRKTSITKKQVETEKFSSTEHLTKEVENLEKLQDADSARNFLSSLSQPPSIPLVEKPLHE